VPTEIPFGDLQRDGLALADRMCAQCHAIGPIGASAHNIAPATSIAALIWIGSPGSYAKA
jgi:hypothetical protein